MPGAAAERADTPEVVMYGTGTCPYCVRARRLLARKGVDYRDIRLEGEPALRAEMERLSGQRTVPQIFIGGEHIGGSDDLHALERSGKLDRMLAAGPGNDTEVMDRTCKS